MQKYVFWILMGILLFLWVRAMWDKEITVTEPSPINPDRHAVNVWGTEFDKQWPQQQKAIVAFRVSIYDHLERFLKDYDQLDCQKQSELCGEMIHGKLFVINENNVHTVLQTWNTLLDETKPYAWWDLTNQVAQTKATFLPLVTLIQRLGNNTLDNYAEYPQELWGMLHGLQGMIKYTLLRYSGWVTDQLPRTFVQKSIE